MPQLNRVILFGMKILLDEHIVDDKAVVVENGRIHAIISRDEVSRYLPAKKYDYPADHLLVPGFIDLHIHGANGHDVMDGTKESLMHIAAALAEEGVTGFLATTMTTTTSHLESVLKNMPSMMAEQSGAAILGVHLEGPFIAAAKRGAQSPQTMTPDNDLFMHWQRLSQHAIKLVTLAPELQHAHAFIAQLKKNGVIASIGHTNANYEETTAAIQAGCQHATHLFNAMRAWHHREPGAAGALLLADTVMAELIVDGMHLHPATVELALRLKGEDRLLLVTDAMRAKCLGNGTYELGGQSVNVTDKKATLSDGTLAGSTLRLPEAIKNMQQYTACTLPQAIKMATMNPARALGMADERGSIALGKLADLVVMNAAFEVELVLRGGREIARK